MNTKITAEEKHYQKLNKRLNNQVNEYRESCINYRKENNRLTEENSKLRQENDQYKDWVERLLEYTELNEKDIKAACERDQAIASMMGLFKLAGVGRFL
jgi:predicted HicB family RNase H-like nuclease